MPLVLVAILVGSAALAAGVYKFGDSAGAAAGKAAGDGIAAAANKAVDYAAVGAAVGVGYLYFTYARKA